MLETKHAVTSRRIDPTQAKRVADIDPASALIGQYFMQDELDKTLPENIKKK